MTSARFVFPSLSRVSSAPACRVPKSLGWSRSGVAFPARPRGLLLHLRPPAMAAASVGGNGSFMIGEVKRATKETHVHVKINLDGTWFPTGISWPLTGDTRIDDHHWNEDIALAIGTPLDESAIEAILDLSGCPHLSCLVEHLFQSLVNTSGMTLHIRQEQTHTILLRHLSKHLQGPFDKQQNMTCDDVALSPGVRELVVAVNFAFLRDLREHVEMY
ncbi:hypothetical protein ABZP36_004373 [Zizania latifolia]